MDYQDRERRRLAEKKNKKLRDAARKEFSLAVRELASFVKKIDPRVKRYQAEQEEREMEKRKLLEAKAILERKTRLEGASKYIAAEWTIVEDDDGIDLIDPDDLLNEEFGCIVCNKAFKSQFQLDHHLVGLKHEQQVQFLRNELEIDELGLVGAVNELEIIEEDLSCPVAFECIVCVKVFSTKEQLIAHEQNKKHRNAVKATKSKVIEPKIEMEVEVAQEIDGDWSPKSSTGKKKRRAAKDSKVIQDHLKCNVCKESFLSKTKLFNHINATDHASAK